MHKHTVSQVCLSVVCLMCMLNTWWFVCLKIVELSVLSVVHNGDPNHISFTFAFVNMQLRS